MTPADEKLRKKLITVLHAAGQNFPSDTSVRVSTLGSNPTSSVTLPASFILQLLGKTYD